MISIYQGRIFYGCMYFVISNGELNPPNIYWIYKNGAN